MLCSPRKLLLPLFLMLFCLGPAPVLMAQDADAPPQGGNTTLLGMFSDGGWAMYPLTLLSVSAVGLTIYNFMMVRQKILAPAAQIDQLKSSAEAVDLEAINNICSAQPTAIGNIFIAGMERISSEEFNKEMIQEAMEEASAEELAAPYAMINYLNVIASLSPMVGMLGTVSGMVKAFSSIQQSGGMADPAEMAGNISEALITTASGLVIAIPTMFFFFFFKNKYGKIVTTIARANGDIFNRLYLGVHYPHLTQQAGMGGEEEYGYEEE